MDSQQVGENETAAVLRGRIRQRTARICVIGLGYVGLPLAVEFAKLGYPVCGVDIDDSRVTAVRNGVSYIGDVSTQDVRSLVSSGLLTASSAYSEVAASDVIFICVPTPFTPMRAPDTSYVLAAASGIVRFLGRGKLVLLQSTTYPGTTEEAVLPVLESGGLRAGSDFYLAFSPERVNPGDRVNTVATTPKVVGGLTSVCSSLASDLMGQINNQVIVVSSPRNAEMAKLLENTFRSVNIALVNELSGLCERMGIDIWEVIGAASTKPFGFMPFYPGPGVGGHCILVDPYYLSWKAREYDFFANFIELAAAVNQSMPYHVVELICRALGRRGLPLPGAKVLVLGVAFKKDIDDARNSPAERIIELLLERGALVNYSDPHVPSFSVGRDAFLPERQELHSVPLEAAVREHDCVVVVAGHSCFDYGLIVREARVVVDTCNATAGVRENRDKIVRLGAPPEKAGGG